MSSVAPALANPRTTSGTRPEWYTESCGTSTRTLSLMRHGICSSSASRTTTSRCRSSRERQCSTRAADREDIAARWRCWGREKSSDWTAGTAVSPRQGHWRRRRASTAWNFARAMFFICRSRTRVLTSCSATGSPITPATLPERRAKSSVSWPWADTAGITFTGMAGCSGTRGGR